MVPKEGYEEVFDKEESLLERVIIKWSQEWFLAVFSSKRKTIKLWLLWR